MLCDRATLKTFLRVGQSDTSQDALLDLYLLIADRAVKLWTKRDLETAVYTEYPRCSGTPDLALKQRPVRCYALAGNLTSGLPTVTGISSTANLTAGMPAVGAGVPNAAVIATVDGASQVTLSANATASGTAVNVLFGLAAWLDPGGYYGDGSPSPFPANSQLVVGKDYALDRDLPDGTSKSGVLRRLSGGPSGAFTDWPWSWRRGTLTARLAPGWPAGYGNCKVVYAAGYGVGAAPGGTLPAGTTIPQDLTFAVASVAAFVRAVTPAGVPVQADAVAQQVTDLLAHPEAGEAPEVGTARGMLSFYREVSL